MEIDSPINLELAMQLKIDGYNKPTEYFYQTINLSYSKKGLKKTKNGLKMNHNKFDEFIYSAPFYSEYSCYITNIKSKNSK
jgi:hypothetical protein